MVRTGNRTRMILKELLIEGDDVLAITTPRTQPDWPTRLALERRRLEASPMPLELPDLYFYQDDVVRHE